MAWHELLGSGPGLFSLLVIVFVLGMAAGFGLFFKRKVREDEAGAQRA